MKVKRPKPLKNIKQRINRRRKPKEVADQLKEALETLPRITNETVTEHREEVLSTARKYIYPLRHSKHRIVIISASILVTAIVVFFTYCGLALYHYQSSSTFLYEVTRVIPFPVAKAGSQYIYYENYLFELRHYIHYYETQQKIDFTTSAGQQQLDSYKKQALQNVINNAYVKQMAKINHVSISNREVNDQVTLIRNQNLLGANNQVFSDVLKQYWGWSIDDFKRELHDQMLAQKVVAALDKGTNQKAQAVLAQLKGGADFAVLAKNYSDDAVTKNNSGQFGFLVTKNSQDLSPQTLNALFNLQPGQSSGLVNIGSGLEIDKVISNQNGQIQGAHILFNFQPIATYINQYKQHHQQHTYITLK